MIRKFFSRRTNSFVTWWHAPITRKDKKLGAIVGGIGCFWVGVLGHIMLGTTPASLATIGLWALASVAVGILLGITFPKVITCAFFPFSMFGGGN